MSSTLRRFGGPALAVLLAGVAVRAPAGAQVAQEKVDLPVLQRIRDEGFQHSHIDALAHHLADVIGPRLTGSTAMKTANEWTADELRSWGVRNVVVEPWGEFGRGWERVAFSGRMVAPFVQPLDAQPLAWTGSTRGTVSGPAVIVEAETPADLARYHGKLKGAFVLMQPPPAIAPEWDAPARRFAADSLLAPTPARTPAEQQAMRQRREQMYARFRERAAVMAAADSTLRAEGAAVVLAPSRRGYALLQVQGDNRARDPKTPIPLPQLVLAQEQYGEIWRDVKDGVPVTLETNIQNRFLDRDLQAYNTLGDIPGTDRADEYVMLGAHLDSWQGGTGATDNGAGTLVMLEAMRILRALDLHPRRTIRIGLWSGEEQGLLGSRGWVAKHPELLPEISAYVNVDNGTGRLRGIWDQSNEKAIPVFEQILWPFRDLGIVAVRHGDTGGTDHLSFDAAGVPGFNFIQDPIDYSTRTHHSNVDTFERLQLDDLRQAAVIVAATVYTLANRDEMMPRKPPSTSTDR